jgi:hypothetical protein
VGWRTCAITTVAVLASSGASALGAMPAHDVDLTWSAPNECPARNEVLAEVGSILRTTRTTQQVEARATVTRAPGEERWLVNLAIRSDQNVGERSFEAGSCQEIGSAVALILALAVDPSRATGPEEPRVEATQASPLPGPETASAESVRLAVAAGGISDVGTLPRTALGGGAAFAALYGRARVEARANLWGTQQIADPTNPTQGSAFDLLTAGGRACYAPLSSARSPARKGLALFGCGGLDVSRLAAAGYRSPSSSTAALSGSSTWAAAEASVLGTWVLGPAFALRLDVGLLVPLERPTFVVLAPDGGVAGELHRPAPLSGRLGLSAEVRIF